MINIALFFLKVLSRFPRWFHQLLSFTIYLIIRLLAYRKSVINRNLAITFPDKSNKEKYEIRKEFYRIFADYFVEIIMLFNVNKEKLVGTSIFAENIEIFNQLKEQKKSVVALTGHVFNWEWVSILIGYYPQKNIYAVYKPLKNKQLDKALEDLRFRLGGKGLSSKEVFSLNWADEGAGDSILYFIADQSPKASRMKNFVTFFDTETATFTGYETISIRMGASVIYVEPEKLGLGKYIYHFKEIKADGEKFEKGEIIQKFYDELEKSIKRNPANWLWSHMRWKNQASK